MRYATIETPEKYYLRWAEEDVGARRAVPLLDRQLLQVCAKERLLELIHDFVVFDAGHQKLCRQNQYFGVKAAQVTMRVTKAARNSSPPSRNCRRTSRLRATFMCSSMNICPRIPLPSPMGLRGKPLGEADRTGGV